nr:OR27 variant 2 [Culex quinquefasciatus]
MDTVRWASLPEDLRVMPFNLRFMGFIGLWGVRRKVYKFLVLLIFATMVIMFPKVVLGIGSSDITVICKGVAEFVFELPNFVTLTILALKRQRFETVIQGLDDFFREVAIGEESKACYDLIRKQNNKIKKVFNFLVQYCAYGTFGFWLPAVLISHWRFWTHSDPLIFELPMEQEFYWLNIRTNFAHYHIFVGLSIFAYTACGFFQLLKVTTTCFMIKYSSLTYRLISAKVKMLPQPTDDDQRSKVHVQDLKKLVDLHRKAYGITDMIEEICQIPVAMEFFSCVIVWCLGMIYISQKIDINLINVMLIFSITLLQVFGYSYLGSELAEEAEAVGKAIYDLPWYEHSVELQRFYRLIIQRTQRPTGITGVKFFIVQRTSFATVVQMSYSYYLVLKDLLNKL